MRPTQHKRRAIRDLRAKYAINRHFARWVRTRLALHGGHVVPACMKIWRSCAVPGVSIPLARRATSAEFP